MILSTRRESSASDERHLPFASLPLLCHLQPSNLFIVFLMLTRSLVSSAHCFFQPPFQPVLSPSSVCCLTYLFPLRIYVFWIVHGSPA